jgi:hypothetical protein
MGVKKTIAPQQKESMATESSPSNTAAPPIAIGPDPLLGNAALGGLLRTRVSAPRIQRVCGCGGHTAGGGECLECLEKRLGLQTKLLVNEPGDRYEQEAERVADEVMTMPARSAKTVPAVSL